MKNSFEQSSTWAAAGGWVVITRLASVHLADGQAAKKGSEESVAVKSCWEGWPGDSKDIFTQKAVFANYYTAMAVIGANAGQLCRNVCRVGSREARILTSTSSASLSTTSSSEAQEALKHVDRLDRNRVSTLLTDVF